MRYGWQIDMFAGYSGVTPSLWSLMGYDGMVIRFEGPDDMRAQWTKDKTFEFVWAGSGSIPPERSAILTHVIEWNYGDFIGEGWGFDWAYSRWQTPSPAVNSSNVRTYADTLVAYAKQRAVVYQGPVLIPWGAGDA